ncbi:hypothetical protein [Streptomyces griseoaurantiacus]|nr:hypothetical protein [Streptomyces jietaisiensis]
MLRFTSGSAKLAPTLERMSAPARLFCLALLATSAWCVDDGLCRR